MIEQSSIIPEYFKLYQNYPNPFNPVTNIKFDIPRSAFVKISIIDLFGKEIEVLMNKKINTGIYEIKWNGTKFSSGIYFIRLESNNLKITNKIILLK